MKNTFSLTFSQITQKPVWQQWAGLIAVVFGLFALLYFVMLKAPLQQLQVGQVKNDALQQSVSEQQHRLLLRPSLAELSRQQALFMPMKNSNSTLVEKVAGPLRQSAGTLVQWQPVPQAVVPGEPSVQNDERGSLTLQADFNGLLALLRGLLNEPSAPTLSQLHVRADKSLLRATLSLAAENITSSMLTSLSTDDAVSRDPFSSLAIEGCSNTRDAFREVILGGVIGNAEHQKGWMLWPGQGWQQAVVGWRDAQSGWQIEAVEARQIIFNLQQPSCAIKQHVLALPRR